jgi:hypothetical protein
MRRNLIFWNWFDDALLRSNVLAYGRVFYFDKLHMNSWETDIYTRQDEFSCAHIHLVSYVPCELEKTKSLNIEYCLFCMLWIHLTSFTQMRQAIWAIYIRWHMTDATFEDYPITCKRYNIQCRNEQNDQNAIVCECCDCWPCILQKPRRVWTIYPIVAVLSQRGFLIAFT